MSSVVLIVLSNDPFLYFYCFCFQMKKYTFGALIQPQRTKKGLVVVLEFMSNLLSADFKKNQCSNDIHLLSHGYLFDELSKLRIRYVFVNTPQMWKYEVTTLV